MGMSHAACCTLLLVSLHVRHNLHLHLPAFDPLCRCHLAACQCRFSSICHETSLRTVVVAGFVGGFVAVAAVAVVVNFIYVLLATAVTIHICGMPPRMLWAAQCRVCVVVFLLATICDHFYASYALLILYCCLFLHFIPLCRATVHCFYMLLCALFALLWLLPALAVFTVVVV